MSGGSGPSINPYQPTNQPNLFKIPYILKSLFPIYAPKVGQLHSYLCMNSFDR